MREIGKIGKDREILGKSNINILLENREKTNGNKGKIKGIIMID